LIGHWTFDNTLEDSSPIKNTGQMFTLLASMVTAPDGRTFISEKNTGKIAIMKDEKILEKPFAILNDSYVDWEQGLLGLAIDPKFVDNHFVYLYYTAINSGDNPVNRIVRFTDRDNVGTNMTVIFDNIPASNGYHSGGAMAFGPDDKLYITVGDALNPPLSQSESELSGKILRINSDGSIPKDNPFPGSPVYTLGHRNMFGIAFDDKDHIGIVTENGDIHYDEINLIKKGGNYGFPTLQPANISPELSNSTLDIKPLRSYWHTIAPTQAIYYTGDRFPILKDTFLFGTYTGQIYSVHIDNYSHIIDSEEHIQINQYPFESVIGITQNPNGDIYYGGYHIYKLENVYENQATPILFPLKFDYPKNIVLDNVLAKLGNYVIVYLDDINNKTYTDTTSQHLKVKLPTSTIDGIRNVEASIISSNDGLIKKIIPFSLNQTSPEYNDITIPITLNGSKIQIIINSNYSTGSIKEVIGHLAAHI
jgi:glucose/arabinose dehydrogenase